MKVNRSQFLCFALLVAVLLNTVVHFTSPAYKFYRQQFERVDKSFSDFQSQVKNDFLPSLYLLATNRVSSVASSVASLSSGVSSNIVSLAASVFTAGGDYFLTFEDWTYKVGDFLLGSPIVSIGPSHVKTASSFFFIRRGAKGDR